MPRGTLECGPVDAITEDLDPVGGAGVFLSRLSRHRLTGGVDAVHGAVPAHLPLGHATQYHAHRSPMAGWQPQQDGQEHVVGDDHGVARQLPAQSQSPAKIQQQVLPEPGPMIPPRHPSNLHPAGLLNQRPILPSAGIKDDTVAAGGETPAEIEPDLLRRSAPRRRHGKKKPKGDRDIHQAGGTAAATACSKPAVVCS